MHGDLSKRVASCKLLSESNHSKGGAYSERSDPGGTEYTTEPILYLAFELGKERWKLGFGIGLAQGARRRAIDEGDLRALQEEISLMEFLRWREFRNRREVGGLAGLRRPRPIRVVENRENKGSARPGTHWCGPWLSRSLGAGCGFNLAVS